VDKNGFTKNILLGELKGILALSTSVTNGLKFHAIHWHGDYFDDRFSYAQIWAYCLNGVLCIVSTVRSFVLIYGRVNREG
jgi:hypothetical protein